MKVRRLGFAAALLVALALPTRLAAAATPPDGFASVNMVDLLWSYAGLTAGNASYARAAMRAACSDRGFTFIRFAALPFWAADLKRVYLANYSGFWALSDALVADAAAAGCGLMPSLFWDLFTFADAFSEPAGVVFDEQLGPSAARNAMEAFAVAYATRYATSSAVVAFELGNENNLLWDLNQTQQQDSICVPCGSPPFRTSADNISTAAGVVVQARLASLVAAAVSAAGGDSRPISSGHAMARPDATWLRDNFRVASPPPLQFDTLEEFLAITAQQQRGVSLLSQHIYAGSDNERFGITDPMSPAVLVYARQAAAAAGQTLLVGEFGDGEPGNRTFTRNVLALLASWRGSSGGAPFFGLVWAFELLQQAASFSLFPGRDDDILAAIVAHNNVGTESTTL
jgi:hypothetical protein